MLRIVHRLATTVVALSAIVLVFSPAAALSKGIADPEPIMPMSSAALAQRNALAMPRTASETVSLLAMPTDAFAVAVASNFGRATRSWSERLPVPLLGPLLRGVVGIGELLVRTNKSLKDNYGLSTRRYGDGGVAFTIRRRF